MDKGNTKHKHTNTGQNKYLSSRFNDKQMHFPEMKKIFFFHILAVHVGKAYVRIWTLRSCPATWKRVQN